MQTWRASTPMDWRTMSGIRIADYLAGAYTGRVRLNLSDIAPTSPPCPGSAAVAVPARCAPRSRAGADHPEVFDTIAGQHVGQIRERRVAGGEAVSRFFATTFSGAPRSNASSRSRQHRSRCRRARAPMSEFETLLDAMEQRMRRRSAGAVGGRSRCARVVGAASHLAPRAGGDRRLGRPTVTMDAARRHRDRRVVTS
jgi:hypothetical protein